MDAVIQLSIRNSDLIIPKEKRSFLTYPKNGLVPCTLSESEDSISLLFNTDGLEEVSDIFKLSGEEQLRFLINCMALFALCDEYEFSLAPENIMIDINLRPRLLLRDAAKNADEGFRQKYMALMGSVLYRKYKYEDYLNGGQDLYKKNKLLLKLSSFDSLEEIKDYLMSEYLRLAGETRRNKKTVPKKNIILSRIAIPLLTIITITAAYLTWDAVFRRVPEKDSVIAANTAYIAEDYLGVQQALETLNLSALSNETKYILSRSYASTEALADDQKEHVLTGLTRRTETIIFDYWILLGRMDFDGAIDIAQRLSENELLLFAYLKYEAFIRNDATISGEEKVAILSGLENEINGLIEAREETPSADTVTP